MAPRTHSEPADVPEEEPGLHAVPEPEGPVDPFDVEALRATPPTVTATVRKVVLSVACTRPSRDAFIRVHPDDAYTIDGTIRDFAGAGRNETYWVPVHMRDHVPSPVQAVRLLTYVDRYGNVALWPAKLPRDDSNFGRSWHDSALAAADRAKAAWVKVGSNPATQRYEVAEAVTNFGAPQWPELTMPELLRLAFDATHVIDHVDHPVLRQLRGEE